MLINATCPTCGMKRRVEEGNQEDLCRKCAHIETARVALPDGAWRYDPFTHVRRYVYAVEVETADAFDEPFVEPESPPEKPAAPIQHGTYTGSRAHYRNGERPCDACKAAEAEYRTKRAELRHAKGDPKFTCECGGFKHRASKSCASCAVRLRNSRTDRKAA